jgi:hypothetical protein
MADQTQTEFLEHAGAGERRAGATPSRSQHTLQDYLPEGSLVAMKMAQDAATIEDWRLRLEAALPQNSATTRKRHVESLTRWFFRDGLAGFAPKVWARYRDPELQLAIHRYLYLTVEPIMSACVTSVLARLGEGIMVPADYLPTNTGKVMGYELSQDTRKRLLANLRRLGLLERGSAGDRVIAPPLSKTALLLALHHAFNIDAPRTIEFAALAENPFWRFVGLRSEDALRDFLREAEHAGLLGKYVIADRLEQITTCYSIPALIQRGAVL